MWSISPPIVEFVENVENGTLEKFPYWREFCQFCHSLINDLLFSPSILLAALTVAEKRSPAAIVAIKAVLSTE